MIFTLQAKLNHPDAGEIGKRLYHYDDPVNGVFCERLVDSVSQMLAIMMSTVATAVQLTCILHARFGSPPIKLTSHCSTQHCQPAVSSIPSRTMAARVTSATACGQKPLLTASMTSSSSPMIHASGSASTCSTSSQKRLNPLSALLSQRLTDRRQLQADKSLMPRSD